MSARALEFVETWVSEKIEAMETLPAEGDEAAAKTLANECFQAALDEDVPAAEIQEAFDVLPNSSRARSKRRGTEEKRPRTTTKSRTKRTKTTNKGGWSAARAWSH